MHPFRFVSLLLLPWFLLGACSEPCPNFAALPGQRCGMTQCSRAGYCVTDAGPPTCAPLKAPGAPCSGNGECVGGTCELDGGCGSILPGGSSAEACE